jgi:hypothetical protein
MDRACALLVTTRSIQRKGNGKMEAKTNSGCPANNTKCRWLRDNECKHKRPELYDDGKVIGCWSAEFFSRDKRLTAGDIASAVAMWAKANGYTVYSCGTSTQADGSIVVEADVRG